MNNSSSTAIRVVIADDVLLIRSGLVRLLSAHEIKVVGEAGNPDELLQLVASLRPDAVIVDIRMPPTRTNEGILAAQRIRSRYPATAILVLSQYLAGRYAEQLLESEPSGIGYLLKERVSNPEVLIDALRQIIEGKCLIDPEIVRKLLARSEPSGAFLDLTPRERDVLQLMAEGRSNAAIATSLRINERTVESVCAQVFRKLDLPPDPTSNRRVLAVLQALGSRGRR